MQKKIHLIPITRKTPKKPQSLWFIGLKSLYLSEDLRKIIPNCGPLKQSASPSRPSLWKVRETIFILFLLDPERWDPPSLLHRVRMGLELFFCFDCWGTQEGKGLSTSVLICPVHSISRTDALFPWWLGQHTCKSEQNSKHFCAGYQARFNSLIRLHVQKLPLAPKCSWDFSLWEQPFTVHHRVSTTDKLV